ncbi:MAG: hypothetical protein AB7E52_00600 [Bdellovibrionales bacterium]
MAYVTKPRRILPKSLVCMVAAGSLLSACAGSGPGSQFHNGPTAATRTDYSANNLQKQNITPEDLVGRNYPRRFVAFDPVPLGYSRNGQQICEYRVSDEAQTTITETPYETVRNSVQYTVLYPCNPIHLVNTDKKFNEVAYATIAWAEYNHMTGRRRMNESYESTVYTSDGGYSSGYYSVEEAPSRPVTAAEFLWNSLDQILRLYVEHAGEDGGVQRTDGYNDLGIRQGGYGHHPGKYNYHW